MPDTLVVTRGLPARTSQAAGYADAVSATGATDELLDAGDYTHADVNARLGATDDQVVTPAVDQFLAGCLG